MPTVSAEDYLKQIRKLQEGVARVSTSALAASLGVADASVTAMLKKLARQGLVSYQPYQGVTLTEKGEAFALRTLRRHRLWELFLVRHLGFSWDRIHEEAERLEHATSEALEAALDRALGFPGSIRTAIRSPATTAGSRCTGRRSRPPTGASPGCDG